MLSIYFKNSFKNCSLREEYNKFLEIYESDKKSWNTILQDRTLFKPFGIRCPVYEINEFEKLFVYNKDVINITKWANENIILKLGKINYNTTMVLIRILTGMINKLSISKEYKILMHDNAVKNIKDEYYKIQNDELPF